jgi:hypothetical protein
MSFTDFKEVTSNNSGSGTRYGGNDLKELMQILNNKIVSGRRISIKNPFRFTDNFDLVPPLSAPGNPPDANSSRIYADPSDFKIKIKKTGGTVIDIENLDIANSALQTITDKAKLHSAIFYKDVDNNVGAHWVDVGQIATPSNPSAGTRRLFVDNATGELSIRTSAGATTSLETGGGGGGGGDVFLNQANTFGDFNSTFRSSRLLLRNPANTFSYTFVGAAITAGRNITLPLLTGNDTMVTEAFAQTLTNKTIAAGSNTISGIGDSQIATHTTTKITTTAKGQLNTAIVYTDQANTFGAFDQSFPTSRLRVGDSDASHFYLFAGSNLAANRTITLPLLTGNDTAVMEAFTQTLTNKTINTTDNSLTATSQATGDVLTNNGSKFVRKARGTALQVLRVNSGGTDVEYASLDSERVGKHQANGNGSATVFNIAHGNGSTPTYAFISVAQSGTTNPAIDHSFTVDATNIVVTFASAPSSGTNNVVIYWRVVA